MLPTLALVMSLTGCTIDLLPDFEGDRLYVVTIEGRPPIYTHNIFRAVRICRGR